MVSRRHKSLFRYILFTTVLALTACASDPNSYQPTLIQAVLSHDSERVSKLLKQGYSPNVRSSDYNRTAIYYAAEKGYDGILSQLIKAGGDVNLASSEGWPPLLVAARYNNRKETIYILLDAGANINVTNKYKWNALMLAIRGNSPEVVEAFLQRGLDPALTNDDGDDAYALARKSKNITPEMIRETRDEYLLREAKASIRKRIDDIEKRDANLEEGFKHDKYLIAFTDSLKSENYQDAVVYAALLDKLATPMEDAFYYFWGEALIKTGQSDQAKEKLNQYIQKAGSKGKYYAQALRLIIQAEK